MSIYERDQTTEKRCICSNSYIFRKCYEICLLNIKQNKDITIVYLNILQKIIQYNLINISHKIILLYKNKLNNITYYQKVT